MASQRMKQLLSVTDITDIEMLEAVGIGVAMGNAKDEVKAKADFVCQSVENDGIYHYCVENKLIF